MHRNFDGSTGYGPKNNRKCLIDWTYRDFSSQIWILVNSFCHFNKPNKLPKLGYYQRMRCAVCSKFTCYCGKKYQKYDGLGNTIVIFVIF